jgi:hypothetical protein
VVGHPLIPRSGRRAAASAAASLVVALSLTGSAFADKPQVRLNAADQAAARKAVLRQADLGSAWAGGSRKPNLATVTCPNYHPKQSNLVVTGAADSDFQSKALAAELNSEAEVLKTARMVSLDWKQSVVPGLLECLRSHIAGQRGLNIKVTLAKRFHVANVATHVVAFRFHMKITRSSETSYFIVDYIFAGQGRAELSLETTAFLGAAPPTKAGITAAERNMTQLDTLLGRTLIARSVGVAPGSA